MQETGLYILLSHKFRYYKITGFKITRYFKRQLEYDKRIDEAQTNSLLVRIESDFGVSGLLPILVLVGTIMRMFDVVVIYCFLYYFISGILMIMKYIIKAIKKTKMIEKK